jgi:acetoacetate decarboxylase
LIEALPDGFEPHPDNTLQLNMYTAAESQTSHLKDFTLTYLTIELANKDAKASSEQAGDVPLPGRYWVGYWNSSPEMQAFTREAGIPAENGTTTWDWEGDNLTSTLAIDGEQKIQLNADAANPDGDNYESVDRFKGHLNYYSNRQIPTAQGGAAAIDEIVWYPIPFAGDVYEAEPKDLEFSFSDDHRISKFQPKEVTDIFYANMTFTYPQGRVYRDNLAESE